MGELPIIEHIRQWIGGVGWYLFLWGYSMSEDQYFTRLDAESAPKSPNMPSAKSCDYCSEPDDALGSICKKCLQRFMERSA